MRTFTSAEAKNNFGELIDLVRAAPVMVTNYDRPRVMVMASEGYERMKATVETSSSPRAKPKVNG